MRNEAFSRHYIVMSQAPRYTRLSGTNTPKDELNYNVHRRKLRLSPYTPQYQPQGIDYERYTFPTKETQSQLISSTPHGIKGKKGTPLTPITAGVHLYEEIHVKEKESNCTWKRIGERDKEIGTDVLIGACRERR